MVKIVEGVIASNKALKDLCVTISFQAGKSVQSEFHPVKDALLEWQRLRGDACVKLEIEYEAEEAIWHPSGRRLSCFGWTKSTQISKSGCCSRL